MTITPSGLELLQQRRRDVVDAAGDDDLVERRRFRPAVIAVGVLGRDRRIRFSRVQSGRRSAAGPLEEGRMISIDHSLSVR